MNEFLAGDMAYMSRIPRHRGKRNLRIRVPSHVPTHRVPQCASERLSDSIRYWKAVDKYREAP